MMEPAGDSSLEAAIAWLVQTILATLLIDKMEEWIQQVGLANEVKRLQSEVERVEMVVAAVKGRAARNRPLSRALARVKELLYDADDVMDELDNYRLQQQVEGVTSDEPDGMRGAERVDEISRGHVDTLEAAPSLLSPPSPPRGRPRGPSPSRRSSPPSPPSPPPSPVVGAGQSPCVRRRRRRYCLPSRGLWVARDAPSRGCDPDLDRGGADLDQGALMDNDGVAAGRRPSGGLGGRAGAALPDLGRRPLG